MQFYSIYKFSKILGVTSQTVRNWDRDGKLKPHHITTNGHRYYSEEQLNQVIGKRNPDSRKIIGYCRVSSVKQKDDLARQVCTVTEYIKTTDKPFEIITDIGTDINYRKQGLQNLIKQIISGNVGSVVILSKDRLMRFGFELVEYIASLCDCKIVVLSSIRGTDDV